MENQKLRNVRLARFAQICQISANQCLLLPTRPPLDLALSQQSCGEVREFLGMHQNDWQPARSVGAASPDLMVFNPAPEILGDQGTAPLNERLGLP
jgi:hypothetical protein